MTKFNAFCKAVSVCMLLLYGLVAVAEEQVVIANQDVQEQSLTLNQLRAIFSLRAGAWPNGKKITVVVLEDRHPSHKSFLVNNLKMLPHQLRRQWDRYIYSGIGQGPTVVKNKEDMIDAVSTTPGAVGYIDGGESSDQILTLSIQ